MGLGKFQNEKPQKIRHQKLSDPYKYSDQWTNEGETDFKDENFWVKKVRNEIMKGKEVTVAEI